MTKNIEFTEYGQLNGSWYGVTLKARNADLAAPLFEAVFGGTNYQYFPPENVSEITFISIVEVSTEARSAARKAAAINVLRATIDAAGRLDAAARSAEDLRKLGTE